MSATKRQRQCSACIVLALSVALVCRADAHTTPDWGPCECDATGFTLTAPNPGGAYAGTVTVFPEKSTYQRGDFVMIAYTPDEDEVFISWSVDPPSHIASGSRDLATALYITGNTTIYPSVWPKQHTVTVSWGTQGGTVGVPAGASAGSFHYTIPVEYGDTHTATATPNTGKRAVWHGVGSPWGDDRLGDSVTVKVFGELEIKANFQNIPDPLPTYHMVSAEAVGGSADLYGAMYTNSGRTALRFLGGVQTTGQFHLAARAQPGYHFIAWAWQDNGTKYQLGDLPGSYTVQHALNADRTYTAFLRPDILLTFDIVGSGVVASGDFKHAWNPTPVLQSGYGVVLPNMNVNKVTVSHQACPGWQFQHWAVKDTEDEWQVVEMLPGTPLPGNLSFYMDWHDPLGGEIRVPDGQQVFQVRAVFAPTYQGSLCPCETSEWDRPEWWNLDGYAGDRFQHQVLDPNISPGDQVRETIIYISSTPATFDSATIEEFESTGDPPANEWTILPNRYRDQSGDRHYINPTNIRYSIVRTSALDHGETFTILYKQEMRRVSDNYLYATHPMEMKIAPIPEGTSCGYNSWSPGNAHHLTVRKCESTSPIAWENFPSTINNTCP